MAKSNQDLIADIEKNNLSGVTRDAEATIKTIRNLIESNSRVEDSIDELHQNLVKSNVQSEKLQNRIFYLTIVGLFLAFIQVIGVLLSFLPK